MTALLESPIHAPYTGGDPDVGLRELRHLIEHHIKNQPRSLQVRIGPSEIGTDCDHCLAAKLAGWAEKDYNGAAWLPWVGTCVHAGLETAVIAHENRLNAVHKGGRRYLVEHEVTVGTIGGQPITGHVDLVDLAVGMTVDWKIVGANTLRSAKAGPSNVYRAQAHLYARGLVDAGHRIDTVAIAFLPRNAVTLDAAVWWHEPHDRAVADAALERANRVHANLTALEQVAGVDTRDAWISGLPRAEACFDCPRFPDAPPDALPFADLLP